MIIIAIISIIIDCVIVIVMTKHPADDVTISAWLLLQPSSETKPTVIFFHGNAGNIGFRLPNSHQMYAQGYNVLQVEYRGYGDSQQVAPTEVGLKEDSQAAINFVLNHPKLNSSKIFLFGRSLGGAVAFHLASYCQANSINLAGVIVENTFLSISKMVDVIMPFVAPLKGLILRIGWDNEGIVGGLKVPILYISGSADELVPPSHMEKLHELSTGSSKASIYRVRDGTHNDTWLRGEVPYWNAFNDFVKSCLSKDGSSGGVAGDSGKKGSGAARSVGVGVGIPTMPNSFGGILGEGLKGSGNDVVESRNKKEL